MIVCSGISNEYTLITIHELKPWGFAFKSKVIKQKTSKKNVKLEERSHKISDT